MVNQERFFLRYSPNHNARPYVPVSLVVMHYTGMRSGVAALEWLCHPESKVSAHYVVETDGEIYLLVEEDRRAWHAGVGYWAGNTNINDISIGIEIVNGGHEHGYTPFSDVQMQAVKTLTQDIMRRHDIKPSGVVGHSDIAPLRKQDPGELFPWEWLAQHGVGVWHGLDDVHAPASMACTEEVVQQLHQFGYMMPTNEEEQRLVIEAFQRHYRPRMINGIWDSECQARLERLISSA
jgi:N-acetylmuramoyl-L-alanine amidase